MKLKNNVALSDSGLVFNPETGESYSVNPIGVEITGLMREGKSADEISKFILNKYSTDKQAFEKDFHDFIESLSGYGLLEEDEKAKV
jgi:hypothetical protein